MGRENGGGVDYEAMAAHVRTIYFSIQQYGLSSQVQQYVCGHCGLHVSGWIIVDSKYPVRWLLCPQCGRGSVQNDDIILPSPQTFSDVGGLPVGIADLYDEVRASFSVQAYTGCEMLCRKILMNVAVDKEAKPNQSFAVYVEYLVDKGYVPPAFKDMATAVKNSGNAAAHKIDPPSRTRAEYTLDFTRRILDTMYGAEHALGKYNSIIADQTGADK